MRQERSREQSASCGVVRSRRVCTLGRALSTQVAAECQLPKFQLKSGGDHRMVLTSAEGVVEEPGCAISGDVPPRSCGSGKASGSELLL
jgi:hypothetical protein